MRFNPFSNRNPKSFYRRTIPVMKMIPDAEVSFNLQLVYYLSYAALLFGILQNTKNPTEVQSN